MNHTVQIAFLDLSSLYDFFVKYLSLKQIKTIMTLLSPVSFRKHEKVSLTHGNSFLFFS